MQTIEWTQHRCFSIIIFFYLDGLFDLFIRKPLETILSLLLCLSLALKLTEQLHSGSFIYLLYQQQNQLQNFQ